MIRKTITTLVASAALAAVFACSSDAENQAEEIDDPGAHAPSGERGFPPEEHDFEEGQWYFYIADANFQGAIAHRRWAYRDDGRRRHLGAGQAPNRTPYFHKLRSVERAPSIAIAVRLDETTDATGPTTVELYKGHTLVDEVILTEPGEDVILAGGDISVYEGADVAPAAPGDVGAGEFAGSFAGLGRSFEVEGEASYGTSSTRLTLDANAVELDGAALDDPRGSVRIGWDGDLEAGTHSSADEDKEFSVFAAGLSWNRRQKELEYSSCDVTLDLAGACDEGTPCAGELSLTNCLVDYTSDDEPHHAEVGSGQARFRFDTSAP